MTPTGSWRPDTALASRRKGGVVTPERRAELNRAYYAAHRERLLAQQKSQPKTPEREASRKAARAKWYSTHGAEYRREARLRPEHAANAARYGRKWRAKNPAYLCYRAALRRARKLRATPGWAAQEAIKAIYRTSSDISEVLGVAHHVDHIVPLVHPRVCGLHTEANLQIIPGTENLAKSNAWWPDMPD